MSRLDTWMETYSFVLNLVREQHPDEYPWPKKEIPAILDRMRGAFSRQSYNKDGRAIKQTCKLLGVKYTYRDINAYLDGHSN